MKKSFLFILLCGALFASCADEKEAVFELPNYCILFTHSDATGRDLLDPEVEGSLLDGHIRLTLKGDVFEPVKSLGETRLPSVSLALHHSYNEALSCYVLLFGEFAPSIDLVKEPIAIDWGNDTQETFHFDWRSRGEGENAVSRRQLLLDN